MLTRHLHGVTAAYNTNIRIFYSSFIYDSRRRRNDLKKNNNNNVNKRVKGAPAEMKFITIPYLVVASFFFASQFLLLLSLCLLRSRMRSTLANHLKLWTPAFSFIGQRTLADQKVKKVKKKQKREERKPTSKQHRFAGAHFKMPCCNISKHEFNNYSPASYFSPSFRKVVRGRNAVHG